MTQSIDSGKHSLYALLIMAEDQAQADTTTPTAGGNPSTDSPTPAPEAARESGEAQSPAPETTPAPSAESSAAQKPAAHNAKGSVEEYEAALQAALDPAPEEEPAQAAQPEATPEDEPQAQVAEPAPEDEPEAILEEEPEEEGQQPSKPRTFKRIRVEGLSVPDRQKVAAATLVASAEGITFEEAFARLNPPKPAGEQAQAQEQPAPRGIKAIDEEILALKAEKKDAARDLDTVKMLEIEEKVEALREEMRAAQQAETGAKQQFIGTVNESRAKAVELYPQCTDPNSAFSKDMIALADELEAQKNPLVYQADAPLRIAQMVANRRNIAPAQPGKPVSSKSSTPAKPQSVQQKAVGSPQQGAVTPASGAARTKPQTGPPAQPFGKIRTAEDYENAVQQLVNA